MLPYVERTEAVGGRVVIVLDQHARAARNVRRGRHNGDQSLQPGGFCNAVRVERRQEFAFGFAECGVACNRQSFVGLVPNDTYLRVGACKLHGPVGAAIIDDEDFVRRHCL